MGRGTGFRVGLGVGVDQGYYGYLVLKVNVEVQLGFEKRHRLMSRSLLTNGAVSGFLRLVLGLPEVFC